MPRMPQGFPGMPGMPGMPGFQMPQGQPRQMPQFARMPQQFAQNLDQLEQKYGVDPKRWRCVYPCYINVKKTIPQGIYVYNIKYNGFTLFTIRIHKKIINSQTWNNWTFRKENSKEILC